MMTLDLVPLRSKYPSSGRMTLRYPTPKFGTVPLEQLAEIDLDEALREVLHGNAASTDDGSTTDTTTPQVAEPAPADETTAGKGGQAR